MTPDDPDVEREETTGAESSLDELPRFPLDCLPPALAKYCQAAAKGIDPQMPSDAIALPALAVIGGLIGNRLGLEVKPRSWVEYPVLYVGLIAESGTAKSAALKAALSPVRKIEHELDASYDAAKKAYMQAKEKAKEYKASLRYSGGIAGSAPVVPEPPVRRRIVTTDSTFEATCMNLENTYGMVYMRDELVGWVSGMDAYRGGRGGDRQKWLEMWSSTDITVDRKIDGTIKLRSPVIGVIGGIQPSMLPWLQTDPRIVDGFVERMLFSAHRLKVPDWSDDFIPEPVWRDLQDVLTNLDLLPRVPDTPGEPVGIMLHMTRDARLLYTSWYREVAMLARRESNPSLRAYFSKLRTNCLRIIVICHAVWTAERDPTALIDATAVEQAIKIAAYTEAHYRAFLGETARQRDMRKEDIPVVNKPGPDKQPLDGRILAMIDGAGGRITRGDLTRRLGNTHAVDIDAAINVLIADGVITEEHRGEGQRKTRLYARATRSTGGAEAGNDRTGNERGGPRAHPGGDTTASKNGRQPGDDASHRGDHVRGKQSG